MDEDAASETRQDIGEILDGIDVGEIAAGKDGIGNRSAFGAGMRACEEIIASSHGRPGVKSLHNAILDREAAIVEKARERDAMVQEVLNGLAKQ